MPFTREDLLLGIVVPAAVSLAVTTLAARLSPKRHFTQAMAPVSIVLGFLAGYWLLGLGPVRPEYDWHWIPYSVVLASIPAAVPGTNRAMIFLKFALLAAVVSLAGWLLVPAFELEPPRATHIVVWTLYTFFLSGATWLTARAAAFPPESPGSLLWHLLMIVPLAAASGLLILSGSLSFGQMSAAATAAFLGFAVADRYASGRQSSAGAPLVYSMLISALMLTGKVNSSAGIPTASYLVLPLTPLAYGLVIPGRPVRLSWKRMLWIILFASVICGLAIGPAVAAKFGGENGY